MNDCRAVFTHPLQRTGKLNIQVYLAQKHWVHTIKPPLVLLSGDKPGKLSLCKKKLSVNSVQKRHTGEQKTRILQPPLVQPVRR